MRTLLTTLVILAGLGLLSGCTGPATRAVETEPTQTRFPADRYPAYYDAAIETLRDHGFRIARKDYRFGTVTTYPKESPTVAEFWIDDATSLAQSWSDTLNSQQRTVTVRIEPAAQLDALGAALSPGGETQAGDETAAGEAEHQAQPHPPYTLTVEAVVERLQRPGRYLTHSATGRLTARYNDTPAHLRERGIDGPYTTVLTRDPLLEARLIEAIRAAAE